MELQQVCYSKLEAFRSGELTAEEFNMWLSSNWVEEANIEQNNEVESSWTILDYINEDLIKNNDRCTKGTRTIKHNSLGKFAKNKKFYVL